ncbi:MAG: hypothetical protein KGD64_12185, partial [Candidatus Heimdallarchaeota archaeon]|nr:hypothetical protein [Candidatus Heimdallarchaeota archaeon]
MTDPESTDEEARNTSIAVEESNDWSEIIYQTLFELEKKYAKSLRKKEVLSVLESERDRERVSDAYIYLTSQRESLTDSALYEGFIDMSELRESSYLEQMFLLEQRLNNFGQTVAKSCQSVFFTMGKQTIEYTRVDFEPKTELIAKEDKDEVKLFLQRNQNIMSTFESIFLSYGDILNYEENLLEKLLNKKFKKKELEALLSVVEAEILSKMISEKKIHVMQKGEYLAFSKSKDDQELKGISSS